MPALTEKETLAVLDQWGREGLLRLKKFSSKYSIEKVTPVSAYSLSVRSQYESRKADQRSVPFHGGYVDDKGTSPSINDIPVARPKDFANYEHKEPIPHTDRIVDCPHCFNGQVSCGFCGGSGRTMCSFCSGMGSTTETVSDTEWYTDHDGQSQTRTVSRTETRMCTCMGGQVTCSFCGGSGN